MESEEFRRRLLQERILESAGVDGLYVRSAIFESVVRKLEVCLSALTGSVSYRRLYSPPVVARSTLERAGYVRSFPNLVGAISSFTRGERELPAFLEVTEAGGDWTAELTPVEVSLCTAGCQNVYPVLTGTPLPEEGIRCEVSSFCFRHEPSLDPGRMQSFRQHEFVFVGSPEDALRHRDAWIVTIASFLKELGLSVDVVEANDPFFGRVGHLLATGQREKCLKYELVTSISSESPGAVSSGNYHEDHFGAAFGLFLPDGSVAHSACQGVGLERLALALYFAYGLDVGAWPEMVRARLAIAASPEPEGR